MFNQFIFRRTTVAKSIFIASLIVVVALSTLAVSPKPAAAAGYTYPYNQGTSVTFNITDVTSAWNQWKSAKITSTNAGASPRLRVMGGTDDTTTVSEGMGYGILFASIFDDKATLDGLWLFVKDNLDSNGLMNWHIGNPGQTLGANAASDGDEDMALGLLNACIKVQKGAWTASTNGIDYCAASKSLINAILTKETDSNGNLLPGDAWGAPSTDYPNGIVNMSYFSPAYYRVFGKFTNNTAAWDKIINRMYTLTDSVQSKTGNCSKLMPNWNDFNGNSQYVSWQTQEYAWWSWDAARFAWRVAVDKAWYNTTTAQQTMNEVGSFFSSVGISNIQARYQLNGTSVDSYHGVLFVANGAAAIWAAPSMTAVNCGAATGTLKSNAQQAYNEVLNTNDSPVSYYASAWRLFSMLLITGNFPNFYEMSLGSTPTNTPAPATNTPQPATATFAPPTNTPTGPTATPKPATATSVPPTATSGTLKVQYKAADTITNDNQMKPWFNIVNMGSTSVSLSTLKIRYYFTKDTTTASVQFNCDYAVIGCGNITGAFAAYGPKTTADTYVEIGFTSGSIPANGGSSGEIQARLNKSDWSNFDETNDYSFDATKTSYADWTKVTLYQNGTLVWGTAP